MRGVLFITLSLLFAVVATDGFAFQITPIDDQQLVVELTTEGETPEAAIEAARIEAVKSCVGRVLMGDQLIMADELLVKYLGNYAPGFVLAVEVLEQEFISGRNRITSKVFVNYAELTKDLKDKRFLYKPAYRPRFAPFMTETQDARIVNEGVARNALAVELNNLGMRRYGRELDSPPATTDVSLDEFLLNAAVVSSQRAGVEVIITGDASTTLQDQQKLYFDEYWFYESEMHARIIRVDTGEVLLEAKAKGSASDTDPTTAIETSIQRAAQRVAQQLVPSFEEIWPRLVQKRTDYEVLLTGVDGDLVSIITEHVKSLGIGTKVYVRKEFNKTASIGIVTDQSRRALIDRQASRAWRSASSSRPTSLQLAPKCTD